MGQSIKKRMFKIWRRNHSNKVKNQKRVEKNHDVLEQIKLKMNEPNNVILT